MLNDSSNNKSWNPWWAIVFVAIVFIGAQVFAGIAISVYPWLQHWQHSQTSDWLVSSVDAQFAFILLAESLTIGAVFLFLRHHKQGFGSIGLYKPRWRDLGYGLLAVPPYFVLYGITLIAATALIPGLDINQKQDIGFTHVRGTVPLVLTFISLVILPPITEEIVMRGLLYTSLKKVLPLAGAVIGTSALFAAAHLSEGGSGGLLYIAAIDTFVLSLVLIYLREKTGSLWASITLHAAKNGIAYYALFIAPLIQIHLLR